MPVCIAQPLTFQKTLLILPPFQELVKNFKRRQRRRKAAPMVGIILLGLPEAKIRPECLRGYEPLSYFFLLRNPKTAKKV